MGGKKWVKRNKDSLTWSAGKKRKRGRLTANGQNATKYLQNTGAERPRHSCEMCGSVEATWRGSIVCLCDGCWKQLKSDLHL